MKACIFYLAVMLSGALPAVAATEDDFEPGAPVVAVTGMECSDYFALKTDDTYVVLEWYGGVKPEMGDTVGGTFNHIGFQDFLVRPSGGKLRAYIEDYGLSLDDANDKLKAKCN